MNDEVRVAVLESRVNRLERDAKGEEARLAALEERLALLRASFEVLQARVSIYAALGAIAGGALFSIATDALRTYLQVH